ANTGWSNIDVQLKRRADLIPNLVEAVKGYAAHERGVFDSITEARSSLLRADTPGAAAQANDVLTTALGRLFAVAEAYPDLKASQNFLRLQDELTDTEDKIVAATTEAKRLPPEPLRPIRQLVDTVAIAAGLSVTPQVRIIDDPAPNAFATGLTPGKSFIGVTTGLLQTMPKRELEAVIAHEM